MPDSIADGQPYVFISYASADRERVLPIIAALTAAGVRVWRDQDDIVGGTSYGPAIASAIRGSAAVLILCSDASQTSRNVRQEMAIGWKHDKPYLPLMLDPVTTLPEEVEYWLEGAQWIEVLDHPPEVWLPRVSDALSRLGFAPLRTVPAATATRSAVPTLGLNAAVSVPTPLTDLIGRDADVAEITRLFDTARLVTLTGPGGTGKTRLAIEVAHHVNGLFRDGVAFVPLASIRDPSLVIPTIAAALDVRDAGTPPLLSTVIHLLRNLHVLLVLDNLEQVADAAADIASLLLGSGRLHVLATSRVPLHVRGEREYVVAPLRTPEANDAADPDTIGAMPSVALFVERANTVNHRFHLTAENAAAVAAICRRLDGLPLAIELAAARVKLLSPEAIAARLDQPLAVLTGGARDLPERQQTMRSTIQWSYDLLTPDEQRLFRRLSVFIGGWTFEAAERVSLEENDSTDDIADVLLSLVEQSLVTPSEEPNGDLRLGMLSTIREFGLTQLDEQGETTSVNTTFVRYALDLVEQEELEREVGEQFVVHLDRIEREFDNLRAALLWANDHDAEMAFRLVFGMWHLWYTRGYLTEGRRHLHLVVDRWPDADPRLRAKALDQAGTLASWQADVAAAKSLHEASHRLYQTLDDRHGVCSALFGMARAAHFGGELEVAKERYEACLVLARAIDDLWLIEAATGNLGVVLSWMGDFERGLVLNAEAITIERQRGSLLGEMIRIRDRSAIMLEFGDIEAAMRLAAECLRLGHSIGMMRNVADSIETIGVLAAARHDYNRAARLIGASQRLRQTLNYLHLPVLASGTEGRIATIREALGDDQFAVLVAAGRTMSRDEAIAYALEVTDG